MIPRQVVRLDRLEINVSNLDSATRFYCDALGFNKAEPAIGEAALAGLLGLRAVHTARLRRGGQTLDLSLCDPPGAAMPQDSRSNDAWFQHCALVVDCMQSAYERLRHFDFAENSRDGPQRLPGGILAFELRDPDGHPLELISFPTPDPATAGGIDHSAIGVTDAARSIAFCARLGFHVQARQVHRVPAQEALDALDDVVVDVVALTPRIAAPHVELLGYRRPSGRKALALNPNDIAADRLVCIYQGSAGEDLLSKQGDEGASELLRGPDGHLILLERQA